MNWHSSRMFWLQKHLIDCANATKCFRLDSSFNTILFERLDESQIQTPSIASASYNGNEIANYPNILRSGEHLFDWKIEICYQNF